MCAARLMALDPAMADHLIDSLDVADAEAERKCLAASLVAGQCLVLALERDNAVTCGPMILCK